MKINYRLAIIGLMVLQAQWLIAQQSTLDSLYKKGRAYLAEGQFELATSTLENTLLLTDQQKDSLTTGNILNALGISYDQSGKFETALQYYFKALAIYERIGNKEKTGGALKNIGSVYRVLGDYKSALDFLQQALVVQQAQKDTISITHVLNDIGVMYMDQNDFVKSAEYFNKIITAYRHSINDQTTAYVFNNLGIICAESGQYDQALGYYLQSHKLMLAIGDKYGLALVVGNMGNLYDKKGNFSKALAYHLQNLAIVKEIKSDELLLTSYKNLSESYRNLGDYTNAYRYMNARQSLKDSVYDKQRAKSYAEMEAKYRNEKKQKEIAVLQQQNKIASIELLSQRRTRYLLIAMACLIFVIAVVLYKANIAKKKSNKQLNYLNGKLSEANNSKIKLISILMHDLRSPVSNLLHFLQLEKQAPALKLRTHEKERLNNEIIQGGEHLLETMEDLLIWSKSQMEYFEPVMEEVATAELITGIIQLHEQFANSKNIRVICQSPPGFRFVTDINFIAIILRNLLSNAIKFTPSGGTVILSAGQEKETIILSVKDNGPGMQSPEINRSFDWDNIRSDSSGLGLKLVKEFTEKLGGRLSIQSVLNEGTEFRVLFPVIRA